MRTSIISILGFTLAFCACNDGRQSNDTQASCPEVIVDIAAAKPVEDSILNIGVQKIDTTAQSLYGMATITSLSGDTIFILDEYKSRGLYAYDRRGHLLWAYDKVGQGPGEFLLLSDFKVLPDRISALDMMDGSIINLDRGGNFISKEPLGNLYPSSFGYTDRHQLWLDMGNRPQGPKLVTIAQNDTVAVIEVPEAIKGFGMNPSQSLYQVGDELHYLPSLEPVIYKCMGTTAIPVLKLNFGSKWPGADMFDKSAHSMEVFKRIREEGYVCYLNAFENDSHYCIAFVAENDNNYVLLVNKSTNASVLYDTGSLFKDRPSAFMADGTLLYVGDDTFAYLTLRLP